jgi:hypothetical protein
LSPRVGVSHARRAPEADLILTQTNEQDLGSAIETIMTLIKHVHFRE